SCNSTSYPDNDFVFTVKSDKEKNYTLNVTSAGKPVSGGRTQLNSILNWLLLVPALALLLGNWLLWRKKKKQHEQKRAEPVKAEGKKPPYEIPFENRDLQLINTENVFNSVFRAFRQKAEDEVSIFNAHKSIRTTIQSGGVPELIFTNRLRYTDYLI